MQKNYSKLYYACCDIYGGIRETVEHHGFDYSLFQKNKIWSKEKVIKEIKKLYVQKMFKDSLWLQNNDIHLYNACCYYFQSLKETFIEADIPYEIFNREDQLEGLEFEDEMLPL